MASGTIHQTINEYTTFENLDINQTTLWSLLLMSGYLRGSNPSLRGIRLTVDLSIPNDEVLAFY